jgi:hypothetical protein
MNWIIVILFIISIVLFLLTKYYLLKKKISVEEIEEFENEIQLTISEKLLKYHDIKVNYLDAEEASNLVVKDGDYLKGMNQANLSARNCNSIDEIYLKYKNAFDDITDNEKETVDKFILKLMTELKKCDNFYYNYVKKWINTISIAKAKKWLESGMPHTLDTTIVMDANWFINPRDTTFIHEITHIHQRQSPLDFEDLYPLLGYYYNPVDIKGLESVYPLNRNNPDGMDKYWLWGNKSDANEANDANDANDANTTYWWIGAIFKTAIPTSLSDVNMIALKLNKDDDIFYYLKQTPIQLSKLKEFNDFFGDNQNNYHPNEMTAKFAEWYLLQILNSIKRNDINNITHTYNNYKGYKIYKKYFDNMTNVYYSE